MELRHLRYFLALAEEKHFGRAAERLHMAQPPLSSQIKQLETELGTTLFERTTRRVELTHAGTLLVDRARQILGDVEAARCDVADVGRGAAGVLRAGFSGTATYRLMPEVVRLFQEQLPAVRLQISGEMLTPRMEQGLLENRLDAAVLRPPVQSEEISLDEVEQTRLVVALPRQHRLAHAEDPVSIGEFSGDEVISYPRDSSVASVMTELSRQAGFRPRIVQEATETSTLIALISAGLGIGFLPGSSSLPLHGSIAIRPLAEATTVGLSTAWKAGDDSPLTASFIRLVRQAAGRLHQTDPQPDHPLIHHPEAL